MTQFHTKIREKIADQNLQSALDANVERRMAGRAAALASVPDWPERRQRAHAIRADVIEHLDHYLDQFIAQVQRNGISVHRAKDAAEAVKIVLVIAESANGVGAHVGAQHAAPLLFAKSKSMVSEEIGLNHALEAAGHRVVETDLGEYIIQLRGERPSHIITPAVHLRRADVGKLFYEKLGIPYTEDIPTLTQTARNVLREVFLSAQIGISGVNFGVAESGTFTLVTNEGNGRMVTTLPPGHIARMGMERHGFTRGCLVGNLGQEMGALPREYRAKLIDALEDWQRRTATCLESAQADGEIGPHHDPAHLAAIFWIGWEGAVLRAKLEQRPEPLTIFADGFFAMLN